MPGNVEKRLNLDSQDLYPIGLVKKVHLGFSIACYGKLQSNFLANPIVLGQAKKRKERTRTE